MELLIENKVTKSQTVFTGLTDLCTSALFYQFNICLPDKMTEGEYEYNLIEDDKVIARGVLQIGDYTPEKQIYNNRTNGYTVYGG